MTGRHGSLKASYWLLVSGAFAVIPNNVLVIGVILCFILTVMSNGFGISCQGVVSWSQYCKCGDYERVPDAGFFLYI